MSYKGCSVTQILPNTTAAVNQWQTTHWSKPPICRFVAITTGVLTPVALSLVQDLGMTQ